MSDEIEGAAIDAEELSAYMNEWSPVWGGGSFAAPLPATAEYPRVLRKAGRLEMPDGRVVTQLRHPPYVKASVDDQYLSVALVRGTGHFLRYEPGKRADEGAYMHELRIPADMVRAFLDAMVRLREVLPDDVFEARPGVP